MTARAASVRPGLVVVLAVLAAVSVAPVSSGAAPARGAQVLTTAGYVDRIDAARTLALESRSSPSPARMREVRALLGMPVAVTVADRQRVGISQDQVLGELDGDTAADFGAAADHLEALAAAAGRVPAVPGIEANRVPEALRSAYRGVATRPSLPERFGAWILLFLSRLWRFLSQGPVRASLLWTLVRFLAVGGVAILLVWTAVHLVRQIGLVPGTGRAAPSVRAERVDWAHAAEEALARGEAREAVRALYRVVVEILTERALVPDLPSLTPAECRTAIRRRAAQPPARSRLEATVERQGGPRPERRTGTPADARTGTPADARKGTPADARMEPPVDARMEPRMEALLWAIDRATTAFERVVYGRGAATPADVEALREAERAARAA